VANWGNTAGTVTASLDTRSQFRPGDRVACAGQDYASHAEIVSVPQNLVARIPDNAPEQCGCFAMPSASGWRGKM
jgi:NADPH:quinone reductase-like Zn-dependent oxidoreductase